MFLSAVLGNRYTFIFSKLQMIQKSKRGLRTPFYPDSKQCWCGSRAVFSSITGHFLHCFSAPELCDSFHTGRSSFGLDLDYKVFSLFPRDLRLPPYVRLCDAGSQLVWGWGWWFPENKTLRHFSIFLPLSIPPASLLLMIRVAERA